MSTSRAAVEIVDEEGVGAVERGGGAQNARRGEPAYFGIQCGVAGLGGEPALDEQVERAVVEEGAGALDQALEILRGDGGSGERFLQPAEVVGERVMRVRESRVVRREETVASGAARSGFELDVRQLVGDKVACKFRGGGLLRSTTMWRSRRCVHAICARPAMPPGKVSSVTSMG